MSAPALQVGQRARLTCDIMLGLITRGTTVVITEPANRHGWVIARPEDPEHLFNNGIGLSLDELEVIDAKD